MVYGQRPGGNRHQGHWQARQPAGRPLPQCRYGQRGGAPGPGRYGLERFDPGGHPARGGGRRQPSGWRYGRQRHDQRNGQQAGASRPYPRLIQLSRAEQLAYGAPAAPPHAPASPSRPGGRARYLAPAAAGGAVLIVAVLAALWVFHQRAPQACAQRYAAWRSRTGTSETAAMRADGNALNAAGTARDVNAIDAALEKIGADATADESRPMPGCADPAGFWPQVLSAMRAAGDNASAAPAPPGSLPPRPR